MSQSASRGSVSVVIPCYNSARYLRETVESVSVDDGRALEVLLVDDGSQDETRSIMAELVAEDVAEGSKRRIRIIEQENRGVAAARNAGISVAQNAYIVPLDADDLLQPTMIGTCARALDAENHVSIVYTDRWEFGDVEQVWPAGAFELHRLKYFNQIGYCSMLRQRVWDAIGGYRVNVSGFDDWDFWIATASRGFKTKYVAEPLWRHRQRQDSQLWGLIDRYESLYAQIIVNNASAYSEVEIASALAFLEGGAPPSPLLQAAALVFRGQFLPRMYAGGGPSWAGG
jgi:glycosyltransferase involved in cell wall biosynthesis